MDGVFCQLCGRFNPVHESVYGHMERMMERCIHCNQLRWQWVTDRLKKGMGGENETETGNRAVGNADA